MSASAQLVQFVVYCIIALSFRDETVSRENDVDTRFMISVSHFVILFFR